jgi:hypothetical protein
LADVAFLAQQRDRQIAQGVGQGRIGRIVHHDDFPVIGGIIQRQ